MYKTMLAGFILFLCAAISGCHHGGGPKSFRTAKDNKVTISATSTGCVVDNKSVDMYKKADSHGNHDTLKWCSDSDATYTLKDFKPSIPLTPLQVPTTIDKNCTLPAHVKDDAGLGTYSYTVVDAHGAQCDPNVIVK